MMDLEIKQGVVLPIFVSNRALSQASISKIQPLYFSTDWFGEAPLVKTSFRMVADPEKIYFNFECQQQPFYNKLTKTNQFIEGLWHYDLVEIFFKEDNSSRYQEFNLSPTGAWWSALFSSYRNQKKECNLAANDFYIDSSIDSASWRVQCSINRKALNVNCSMSSISNANITAIINGKDKQYLSWSRIATAQPDFHKIEDFCQVLPVGF